MNKLVSTKLGIFLRIGRDNNGNPLYSISLSELSRHFLKYAITSTPDELGFEILSAHEARFTSYSLTTDMNDIINTHSRLLNKNI